MNFGMRKCDACGRSGHAQLSKCDKCGFTTCSECSTSSFCNQCKGTNAGPPGSGTGLRKWLSGLP